VITTIGTIWQQKGLEDYAAAKALFEDWYHSSLMDYVAASHSGLYQPFLKVLRGTLARTLYRRLAIVPSEDHVEQVMWAFRHRLDSATEALEALRLALNEGWAVWLITLADQDDTWEFLKQQGIDGSLLWIMCCDEYKGKDGIGRRGGKRHSLVGLVATPHPKIYAQVMRLTVRHTQKIEVMRCNPGQHSILNHYLFIIELLYGLKPCVGTGGGEECQHANGVFDAPRTFISFPSIQ
jgi:FMN phosphatase YigB (HAD superfamily)